MRTLKKALCCIHVAVLGDGSGKVSNLVNDNYVNNNNNSFFPSFVANASDPESLLEHTRTAFLLKQGLSGTQS